MKKEVIHILKEKFKKEYDVQECIRYDVIMEIKKDIKNIPEHEILSMLNMPTNEQSIKKLENFRKVYFNKMKRLWLIDLLIELQKKSVENINKSTKMKDDSNIKKVVDLFLKKKK